MAFKAFYLLLGLSFLSACTASLEGNYLRLKAELIPPGERGSAAIYPNMAGQPGGGELADRFGSSWKVVRVHPGHDFN